MLACGFQKWLLNKGNRAEQAGYYNMVAGRLYKSTLDNVLINACSFYKDISMTIPNCPPIDHKHSTVGCHKTNRSVSETRRKAWLKQLRIATTPTGWVVVEGVTHSKMVSCTVFTHVYHCNTPCGRAF